MSNPPPTASTTRPGTLAISALPQLSPFPMSVAEFIARVGAAFDLTYGAGARGQLTTFTWKALEPVSGTYDAAKLAELNDAIAKAQSSGMAQFIGLQAINTTNRELPVGIDNLNFDDANIRSRFHALLDQVIGPNVGKIKYLSIGNEVDAYLRAHSSEWMQYQVLYEDALLYAHGLDPAIRVGVTATADGALTLSAVELQELNAKSDVVILTYYPLQDDGAGNIAVRNPAVVDGDFGRMLNFAATRPLLLQEVGYPASPINSSSEFMQAAFVSNIFASWKKSNGRIPFVNFFQLHDFTVQMCDDFSQYYGLPNNASFKSFLCSLGLRKEDGTARLAWTTLQSEAAQAGFP